ncbi:MAG: hypothetical protein LDL51_01420 [Chloroflexi bacterium]|nr:hypothetical protein [Chloroflexota bacterium]
MYRCILFQGFVLFFLSACAAVETPPPSLTPTSTYFYAPAPTFTLSPTPAQAEALITGDVVNCRFGPGTVYESVNELRRGQSARAVGRNQTSSWWYIRDPGNPNGFCWVSANVSEIKGEAEKLPIQPAPFVTVTKATLRGEPTRIVVACDQFPQTIFLEAKITANGPTFVTWKWEASTGVSSQEAVMVFEQAGTQVINDYYQVGAPNDYWIKLRILAPNEITREVKIPVVCSP